MATPAASPGPSSSYFRSGVEHLMGGPDHLVFLLALMLPAVCVAGGAGRAALGVLTAVTGFTLAHALTLTAATTELLRPPTDLINMLIALSIVITAADNVRPFIPAPRAAVAAFFGIIHGFGFASALGALQLTGAGLAVALVGFNLGIEAAQVGVVLADDAGALHAGGRAAAAVGRQRRRRRGRRLVALDPPCTARARRLTADRVGKGSAARSVARVVPARPVSRGEAPGRVPRRAS